MKHHLRAICERSVGKPGEPIRFVASTENLGRDGMVIEQRGWKLDNYRANPVVLWAHDYRGEHLPIGRTVDLVTPGRTLVSDVVFDQDDEFAVAIERKYRAGFLNTVSVGWDILDFAPGRGSEPPRVTGADLLDISAVPVPGDPHALMERQRRALAELGMDLVARSADDDTRKRFIAAGFEIPDLSKPADVDLDLADGKRHAAGLTYDEVRNALRAALELRHPVGAGVGWLWVRDFADTWCVYEYERVGTATRAFRSTYDLADDGTVTLGEAVEVKEVVTWEPRSGDPERTRVVAPHAPAARAAVDAEWAPPAALERHHVALDNPEGEQFPHHNEAGEVVWRGVATAMVELYVAAAQIPDEERRGVHKHLARHYRQFGMEPPEFRTAADLAALDDAEIAGLFLEGEDELMASTRITRAADLLEQAARLLRESDDAPDDTTQDPTPTEAALRSIAETLASIPLVKETADA